MNTCAKPFSLSKLSKFPQNKKADLPPDKTSEKSSPGAAYGERPSESGGKRKTKIPPKMDHPPWRLTGLYEKAPCAKNSASKQTTCSRRINYGSFISDGSKRQTFLNPPPRPKIKRLEVARKRRASFKPTYISHDSFYNLIFQIILRHAHRF